MPVMEGNQKDYDADLDALAAKMLTLENQLKSTQDANRSLEQVVSKLQNKGTGKEENISIEGIQLGPYADQEDWCSDGVKRVADRTDGLWLTIPGICIDCNPHVSCLAILIMAAFVLFAAAQTVGKHCLVTTDSADGLTKSLKESLCSMPNIEFSHWQTWVTNTLTWAYIGTQDAWIVFAIVLFFSKYGKLKLGPADEPPDYSTWSWFAMIFSCGVASGLYFYSVGEPIWHFACDGWGDAGGKLYNGTWQYAACVSGPTRQTAHRYSHLPDNFRAQEAMNLTLYHWGLHGWVCYAMHGALLAFLHFRKGLPICTKSCFYPLLGERVYGWFGDMVDVISIVGTTFGVCTSLGLATFQLNDGIKRRNGDKFWIGKGRYYDGNKAEWATTDNLKMWKEIWDGATDSYRTKNKWLDAKGALNVGTASKIAGVVADNDANILIIWIITTFSTISLLLGLDYGIQVLGNFTFVIGLFLLWAVLMLDDTWYLCNLFVQSMGHYMQWIIQVGFYSGAFDLSDHAAPDQMGENKGWLGGWTIFYWGWWISWAPLVGAFIGRISKGRTLREFFGATVFGATLFNFVWMVIYGGAGLKMQMLFLKFVPDGKCSTGAVNVCRVVDTDRYTGEPHYFCSLLTKLSCLSLQTMMPALLEQYADIGVFLCYFTLFAIFMYFVASSDSGSLVDSMLAANGLPEPSRIQRFVWSMTEGLCACSLLYAGRFMPQDTDAQLRALQAVSIVIGLPWTVLISLECVSMWRACQYECGDRKWGNGFKLSVMDFGITVFSPLPAKGRMFNMGCGKFNVAGFVDCALNCFIPSKSIHQILTAVDQKRQAPGNGALKLVLTLVSFVLYMAFIILVCIDDISVDPCTYWEKGNSLGTTPTKYSTRYGVFHGWGASIGNGNVIASRADKKSGWMYTGLDDCSSVFAQSKELSAIMLSAATAHPEGMVHLVQPKATTTIPARSPGKWVGKRIGSGMRVAMFGWFSYMLFAGIVTYCRATVRSMYKKHGNPIEDFLCSFFAMPTVLRQVKDCVLTEEVPPNDSIKKEVKNDPMTTPIKSDEI